MAVLGSCLIGATAPVRLALASPDGSDLTWPVLVVPSVETVAGVRMLRLRFEAVPVAEWDKMEGMDEC